LHDDHCVEFKGAHADAGRCSRAGQAYEVLTADVAGEKRGAYEDPGHLTAG